MNNKEMGRYYSDDSTFIAISDLICADMLGYIMDKYSNMGYTEAYLKMMNTDVFDKVMRKETGYFNKSKKEIIELLEKEI